MKRFAAWILPGIAVSASVALAAGGFVYNSRNPHLTEIQVMQALPEWWTTFWPLGVGLMAIYVVRSMFRP